MREFPEMVPLKYFFLALAFFFERERELQNLMNMFYCLTKNLYMLQMIKGLEIEEAKVQKWNNIESLQLSELNCMKILNCMYEAYSIEEINGHG